MRKTAILQDNKLDCVGLKNIGYSEDLLLIYKLIFSEFNILFFIFK